MITFLFTMGFITLVISFATIFNHFINKLGSFDSDKGEADRIFGWRKSRRLIPNLFMAYILLSIKLGYAIYDGIVFLIYKKEEK